MDVFTEENRNRYLNETTESLNALLNDAFLEDQNQIRAEFPKGSERTDISVEHTKVSLCYLNDSKTPLIEVAIQVSYQDVIIAEYKSVYDSTGELEEEFFYFE